MQKLTEFVRIPRDISIIKESLLCSLLYKRGVYCATRALVGVSNLNALLDVLMPNKSEDTINEMLDTVGTGRMWTKVLMMPARKISDRVSVYGSMMLLLILPARKNSDRVSVYDSMMLLRAHRTWQNCVHRLCCLVPMRSGGIGCTMVLLLSDTN